MTLDTPAKRLRWARAQHGQYATATEAARAFGWKVSTYLGHENGDRTPSRDTAKRYARQYRVRWEWLLEGEGRPTVKELRAPIVGAMAANGEVILYPSDKIKDSAELPPDGTTRTVAVVVRDGSMRGIADDGWIVFFDHERRPPTPDLLGKLCVVEIDSGDILVRTLQPGRKRGRYDLESPALPTLRDRRVVWAARVTWLRPR